MNSIQQELENRVLVIDGAMGSLIQQYKLSEKDFRSKRFADWEKDLQGNNDLYRLLNHTLLKPFIKSIKSRR